MKKIFTVILFLLTVSLGFSSSNVTTTVGSTVSMYLLNCQGTQPFTYQWTKNNIDIPGATNNYLTLNSVTVVDADIYKLKIFNSAGSTSSDAYTLSVISSPIALPPTNIQLRIFSSLTGQNSVASIGDVINFGVTASGTAPFTYQWYKDGVLIVGITKAIYSISNFQSVDGGNYYVIVSNSAGSTTSATSTLSLTTQIIPPSNAIIQVN